MNNDRKLEEKELIQLLKNHDPKAWQYIVDNFANRLWYYLLSLESHLTREDIEDLISETFMSFYIYINSFSGECSIGTYLRIIAKNKFLGFWRRKEEKKVESLPNNYIKPIAKETFFEDIGIFEKPINPETIIEDFTKELSFTQIFLTLSKKCQKIISLRFYANMTYEDIHRELKKTEPNIKLNTVYVRLHRCIQYLSTQMKKHYWQTNLNLWI